VAVAGGESYGVVLKNSGTVAAWGANIFPAETNVPAGLSGVVNIASGQYSSLALKNNGTVVAWGANISGLTNVPAGLSNNTVAIAGGSFHNLAIKNDGTVVAWGDDSAGQTDVPAGLTNVVAISGGSFHSLALKTNGTVVAWGDNSAGQTNVPAGLNNVVAVAAGGFHSLALKSDGSIVAWGDSSAGQTSVPVGLNNVVAIAGGNLHSLALTPFFNVNPTNPIVLNTTNGAPQTNTVGAGGITYYQINVPANADFATNILLYAQNGPLNVWFTTNSPPTIATNATLLFNGTTNGATSTVLSTSSVPTNIVPGAVYYLGVQNTNNFAVTYAIEVDFQLVTAPPIFISSIVYTNHGTTNGFLLTWFAPSNDLFQVQWTASLAPASWSAFTNIISYNPNVVVNPTNTQFNFFDDGSQTPPGLPPVRFYRLALLGATSGFTNSVPQTNSVPAGSIDYFSITVPTNADFATNSLSLAGAPLTLLFNQNTPPVGTNAGDFTLVTNATGGISILGTNSTPPLVPGATYYLGVKNTNSVAVNFVLEVDFHLHSPTNAPVSISSITYISNGTTNGFLLQWYAPTNDLFQVQWTVSLGAPVTWTTFTNIIAYTGSQTATNGLFTFLDTNAPLAAKFYRLLLVQATNSLTLPLQTNFTASLSATVTVTNTAVDSRTNAVLTYSLTNSPAGAGIGTNGIITWTNAMPAGLAARFNTMVTDDSLPPLIATNTFTIFVAPLPSITNVTVTATNVVLQWAAPTNDQFNVQWTTNLMPVISWFTFPGNLTSTNGIFRFTDTNPPLVLKFYRLIVLP
jgi:hypothetical protein